MISRDCVKRLHEQRGRRPFGRNRVKRGSRLPAKRSNRENRQTVQEKPDGKRK